MKYFVTIIWVVIFINSMCAQKVNQVNKKGNRVGKWITYMDDEKKIKSFEGKFRNGKPIGKSYFYNYEAILDRREINRFKKLKTTFYYPNGIVRLKGNARLENLPDKIHYYFYGKWLHYNEKGELIKYTYYEKGNLLKTVYKDKSNKTNDSLADALILIDKNFTAVNNSLTDTINNNRINTFKYNYYKRLLYTEDSIIFASIERIIDAYGFPSQEVVGEAAGIPFYILGFAPLQLREKYLPQLKAAADKNIISWKSLAYFIDKLKIAKKEKQIYGTQGTYDNDHHYTMYPCEDPGNLEKRRAEVGLEQEP